jgi:beta-fructofuranosidase
VGLRLPDRWIWDFWLALDGDAYHLFFLQAPRRLQDPEQRHWHVTIGHAVSTDLRRWRLLPDALAPGVPGAWDDFTTWTGSVLAHNGRWWMFYTGTSRAEQGKVQRVGLAVSDDLLTWRRHGVRPLIEADPRWYEVDRRDWYELAWRDPWVFPDPDGHGFHALLTARANHGDPATRGVIGHATSDDLVHWTVRPPLTEPGWFGHLEVPQLERVEDRWWLLFSTPPGPGHPGHGTHTLSAAAPLGPYRWSTHQPLDIDHLGSRYGGRLVSTAGGWQLLAWRQRGADGFLGELADPVPVRLRDGRLALDHEGER